MANGGQEVKQREFIQCDVFTSRRFEGNPLAVFLDGSGIDAETMQQVAREMNLSETVFVLPPEDPAALRALRIFTPGKELPMAGHPVVGTWFMLAQRGIVPPPVGGNGLVTIFQQIKLGTLPVDVEFADGLPNCVWMTQGKPVVGDPLDLAKECAAALRLDVEETGGWQLPIVVASTGVPYLIVPIKNRTALSRIRPDSQAITALCDRFSLDAIYAVSPEPHSKEALVSARMFGNENIGLTEDPATGSAAGPLAAALVHFGFAGSGNGTVAFIIEQGVDMGRASRIQAEVSVSDGVLEKVRIGGSAVEVLTGTMPL